MAPETPSDKSRRTPDDIDRELEEMLLDAEQTVSRLRRELTVRREQRAAAGAGQPGALSDARSQALQHAEIERLEQYLELSRVHWGEVRGFFEAALREAVGRRDEVSENGDQDAGGRTAPGPAAGGTGSDASRRGRG